MSEEREISSAEGARIWRNGVIPVIYRPDRQSDLLVRLPGARNAGLWNDESFLRGDFLRQLTCDPKTKAWAIPRSRLNYIAARCLCRYQSLWIIQTYRPLEKCAPACWNAQGYDCQCSCLGENHGSGRALEHVVSETFAFERGGQKLAARFLKQNHGPEKP